MGTLSFCKLDLLMCLSNSFENLESTEQPSKTVKKSLRSKLKKQINKSGTSVLLEIKKYQISVDHLISKQTFKRIVKDIGKRISGESIRFTSESLYALQEAAEQFIVRLFEYSNLCAFHARRITISNKDLNLTRRIRGSILGFQN